MRLLHTADWHLGARLIERDRLREHARFLDWLVEVVRSARIDVLLVSGDVFDAANPPQDAVALYYGFLRRLSEIEGVSAVITGGNHDSASHLDAPRGLLEHFRVHVFGSMPGDPAACVREFGDACVAAVPYLRERDLRQVAAGESAMEAHSAVRAAIRAQYEAVRGAAAARAGGKPIVTMGHLTVLGAVTSDSERDIHVGNLGAIGADVFAGFDYAALGHLHRPQAVGGAQHIRYSGSPIPLSFSEAGDEKSVVLVEVGPALPRPILELIPVPVTQQLVRARVEWESLAGDLGALPPGAWAEVTVALDGAQPDVERLVREAAGERCEVLKVLVELPAGAAEPWTEAAPALDEIQPLEVFRARLAAAGLPDDDPELTATFHDLLALHEAATTA